MKHSPNITVIRYLCALPFVALFACAFIADDWQTHTGIGKSIGFYAVMGVIPIAAGVSYWNDRQSMKYHVVDILIPLLVSMGLFLSYLNRLAVNSKMITLVLLVVLYFCFRIFLVQHKANLYVILLMVMLVGCGEALWGLLQLYGYAHAQHHLFKTTGSFFNPGPYAGYLAVILPMALYYFLRDGWIVSITSRRKATYFRIRWGIAVATLVCISLILPATMSRAAWIAAGVGCLAVAILYGLKVDKRWYANTTVGGSKLTMTSLLMAVFFLAGILIMGLYHLKRDSADGRALIWKVSMDMLDKNWFGAGLGYFSGSYGKAQQAYFASGSGTDREQWVAGEPEYAFNEFIQIAVELGVVPLILLMVALLFAIRTGIRNRRFALVGGLIALFTFAAFSYPFSLMPLLVLLAFLMAACVAVPYEFTYFNDLQNAFIFSFHTRRRWNGCSIVGLVLVSALAVGYGLYTRYPVYVAHQSWGQARLHYDRGMPAEAVEHYAHLFPYLQDEPHYLFEYGRSLLLIGKHNESIDALWYGAEISADPMFRILIGKNFQAQKKYGHAEASYQYAAQQVPQRLYPNYLLAKLYDEMGETEKAYAMATLVVGKAVKIDSPAVQDMKTEMRNRIDRANRREGRKPQAETNRKTDIQ